MTNISIDTDVLRRALDGDEEALKEARALLSKPKPTTGLFGRWATHPKHGEVMIISEKPRQDGMVYAVYLFEEVPSGTRLIALTFEELTFPEQTTRPEDVPPGEPWLLEVDGGEAAIGYRNDPEGYNCWTVAYRDTANIAWLFDSDVTLIAPLVPETTTPEDVPEFDPTYDYIDRVGNIWRYVSDGWRWCCRRGSWIVGSSFATPPAENGPYTRIEKEETNDQDRVH